MKLLTLLLIILTIFLVGYYVFGCGRNIFEFLTPNPYIVSWQSPSYTGGSDSNCCSYDWQICSDAECQNIVDSGTVPKGTGTPPPTISASTTKLDWSNTYYAWVRAQNSAGPGDWSKMQFSTGDGKINSVVIAETIAQDGTITLPLTSSSKSISVWAKLSEAPVTSPNTYIGICGVTIAGNTFSVPLTAGVDSDKATSDIFYGTASLPAGGVKTNDTVSADIYISKTGSPPEVTEVITSFVVIVVAPGAVTSLKVNYSPPNFTPPPPPPFVPWESIPVEIVDSESGGGSGQTLEECQLACSSDSNCKFYSFNESTGQCRTRSLISATGYNSAIGTGKGGYVAFQNMNFPLGDQAPFQILSVGTPTDCFSAMATKDSSNVYSANFVPGSPGQQCLLYQSPVNPNVKTYIKP